ncbi:MAG: Rpn family recombination-promoting nuclease/putative transposase [Gammaproteobacteria bacterium]|nr:Rpn family recombination-promoting nuclease/putative transposase [Gammaproteobacteria bacterium]
MAEPIDPTVDYAFRVLFSRPGNEPILTNFLNAVFASEGIRLKKVLVVNPFNEKEFADDKLTIIDVKAVDEYGRHIQIEIQLTNHEWLHARILFTWSKMYASQLEEAEKFKDLLPAFSIWILGKVMFPDSKALHHGFGLYDA